MLATDKSHCAKLAEGNNKNSKIRISFFMPIAIIDQIESAHLCFMCLIVLCFGVFIALFFIDLKKWYNLGIKINRSPSTNPKDE